MTSKDLGERIKQLRKSLKLTQKEFSEQSGVNTHSISRIEKGDNVGTEVFLELCTFLNTKFSLDTLLSDNFFVIYKKQVKENENVLKMITKERLNLVKEQAIKNVEEIDDILDYLSGN